MKEAEKGGPTIEQLVYVFTKPEGAIANLEFFAQQFEKGDVARRLTIEVFDEKGTKLPAVRDAVQARALLQQLRPR